MNILTRGILIWLGAALLVGGLGPQLVGPIQLAGVVFMSLGAGLIGFGAIRTDKERTQ